MVLLYPLSTYHRQLSLFFAGSLADVVGRPRAVTVGFCIFGLGAAI